jgi:hypothetical protein
MSQYPGGQPPPPPQDPYAGQPPADPYAPPPRPHAPPAQPSDPYLGGQPPDPYAPPQDPYYGRQPQEPYPQQPSDPYAQQQAAWYAQQQAPPGNRSQGGRGGSGAAIVGVLLVLVGIWILFGDQLDLDLDWGEIWPIGAVILGALMVVASVVPRRGGRES